MLSCVRYSMKQDYGREPLHPTPPRSGYGPAAIPQTPGGPNAPGPQQGSVMMVYGLDPEKSNTDRLFNIFCLYGNVLRVSVTVLAMFGVVSCCVVCSRLSLNNGICGFAD